MFSNIKPAKTCNNYYCNLCDYSTCRKSSYEDHLTTTKHQKSIISNENPANPANPFVCQICQKIYKDNSGLWRHKKKCKLEENDDLHLLTFQTPIIYRQFYK